MTETKITTNEINQTVDLQVAGNTVITSNVQLTGSVADGFGAGTVYGWNMDATSADAVNALYGAGGGGTKVGGKDLTVKGHALASATDVIGQTSKYCKFEGAAFLTSTDAALKIATDLSLTVWAYRTSWSETKTENIVSTYQSSSGDKGYELYYTNGSIKFIEFPTTYHTASCSDLATGWHCIQFVRTAGVTLTIYIDGVAVYSGVSSAIGTLGNFKVSSEDDAGSNYWIGYLDELFMEGAVWTSDQVRNIYARSAKKFAVKDQANNVSVFPTPTLASGVYTPTMAGVANIDSLTAYTAFWTRVGNIVTVSGRVDVDPTSANTTTNFTISYPISPLTTATNGRGVIVASGSTGTGNINGGAVAGMDVTYFPTSASAMACGYTFQYEVI